MAVNIDGNGLIALGGTSSTQGRLRLAEDTDNGTNYIELTAPASVASNRTITFPDVTGTVLTNASAGTVLQVVSATYSTTVSTSVQNTWVDSGLSATITPTSSSSRILIVVSQNIGIDGVASGDQQANLGLFRDTTLILGGIRFDDLRVGSVIDFVFRVGLSFLDSPATTSAITYKTAGSLRQEAGSTCRMQYSNNESTITLLEIAG